MKTFVKKFLSLTCAAALLLSVIPAAAGLTAGVAAGGWFESMYAELAGVSDDQVTAVSWSGAAEGKLSGDDLKYLVRDKADGSGVRVDVLGLKAGSYDMKITAAGQDYTLTGIQVLEYDRSGYAHYNYTDGVGAYNNDGTLKAKARVVYVTDANKDSVTLSFGNSTATGIGNILNRKTGLLSKMAKAGTPLVVRIVGDVKAPKGVTEKVMSTDAEKQNGNNGGMVNMASAKDLTIEGVGADATINGWGLSFASTGSDAAQGLGKSFEVRNISFRNVPEDCINIEGVQDDKAGTLTSPAEHCWVHNCAFYRPTIKNPAAVDKAEGDGALDYKRGQYFTMSYCYFEGYHKSNLVGGGDNNLQYHITWHHNHWKNCESRTPLGRQANMHIYNCLFEGQKSYAMNTRANCYIFSEYNTFLNSKNPMRVEEKDSGSGAGGPIKSYNDKFTNCSGDRQGTVVTDKTQTVYSKNVFSGFDTNPAVSYIPSGSYRLDESTDRAVELVRAYAGPMKGAEKVTHPDGAAAPTVSTAPTPAATPAPTPAPTVPSDVVMPADVGQGDWFYPAVLSVLSSGAMKGTDRGFEPHTNLTIASVYQTLYNMEGAPPVQLVSSSDSFIFDAVGLDTGMKEDRAVLAEGTAFSNGFFTIEGKVVQRWQQSKGGVYCVEPDKDEKGAICFTVTGTADVSISASSTGNGNTSAVGLINDAGAPVPNQEGITSVTGTSAVIMNYYGLPAGTYRVVSLRTEDENMNRGVRIHNVGVDHTGGFGASGTWFANAVNWAAGQGLLAGRAVEFTDREALRGDVKDIMDAYCQKKGITATLFKGNANGDLMLDKPLERCEWAQVLTNLEQAR